MCQAAEAQTPRSVTDRGRGLVWQLAFRLWLLFVLLAPDGFTAGVARAQGDKPDEGEATAISFNRDVLPILTSKCFSCHGPDPQMREAGLRLDDRDVATSELDSGDIAIVPGDLQRSALVDRITTDDVDLRMPPEGMAETLTSSEIATLKAWISAGAKYEQHWAFQPPQRPALPIVTDESWVRNPIDRFVLFRLEQEGLVPSPEADRATLIRRLSLDLVGIPPTPEEVEAFLSDTRDDAYERLVDRLMASPHYGERLALPWLDAARYADSNGFQQDGDTWQWIWRDWVVRALNEDLPFDQFTIWQLAGDLLPDPTTDQMIASGFNRNHMLNGEGGAIAEEQRFVNLLDRVDTTATTWLGLTVACAQCHDHKFDPITQRDYYSLMDAFNRVPESGVPQFFSSRIRVAAPFLELPTEENLRRQNEFRADEAKLQRAVEQGMEAAYRAWTEDLLAGNVVSDGWQPDEALQGWLDLPDSDREAARPPDLELTLRKAFQAHFRAEAEKALPAAAELAEKRRQHNDYRNDQVPRVMVMSDGQPRRTSILERGNYLAPTEEVTFSTPAFLPPLADDAPRNRLGLAQWLMDESNPLTARVQVNRAWQYFFGVGLVKTSEDLGLQSEYPMHRELLDWLAVEFREQGWSQKRLNRLILTSATYRQSSRMAAEARERDPENRLLSRASRIRVPSMILRDWALGASGVLQRQIGGQPVYPYQPEGIWGALAITKERDFTYPLSAGEDLYRRSLYTFWRRTVSPANLFDTSDRQACRVKGSVTNTPLHALTLLNDVTWVEASRVLAGDCLERCGSPAPAMAQAFQRVLCRPPSIRESRLLQQAYARQLAIYQSDPAATEAVLKVGATPVGERPLSPEHAALSVVCLMIFNLDEAVTRE